MSERPRLIALLGPTGVGKTEVSIGLALAVDAEIVSADSRLLYRGMDIGTAKPGREALERVRHHLIDVADPDETWSLAVFREAALAAVRDIHDRGRLPLLVGGTGQYLTAILEGWLPPTLPPDPALRRELEQLAAIRGPEALHAQLQAADPAAALRIDARNVRRVVRALELARHAAAAQPRPPRHEPPGFRALRIGLSLPRALLYERIDARIDAMLANGLVEEVRGLLAQGYGRDLPSMSAIGYRQIAAYLAGEASLDQAVQQIRRATRQFVRRQANWFKAEDPRIRWFTMADGVGEAVEAYARGWLSGEERAGAGLPTSG